MPMIVTTTGLRCTDDPLTSSDLSIELACGEGVYLPDTCGECWGVRGMDAQRTARFGVSGINHVISSQRQG